MNVHNLGKVPESYQRYLDVGQLYIDQLDTIEKLGVDEIWYWYGTGSYEGAGQLLMRKGNEYSLHSMGHCSCYGPIESDLEFSGETLEEIVKSCSGEYLKEIEELINLAKQSI